MKKKEEEEGRGEGGGLQGGWEALHEPVPERGSGSCVWKVLRISASPGDS